MHITKVSESNRDANEESACKHEGLLGGSGTPYQTQPSRCLASHHRVSQWKCSLCCISQPQCWCWLSGPRFARCFCLSWLVTFPSCSPRYITFCICSSSTALVKISVVKQHAFFFYSWLPCFYNFT